MSKLSRRLAAGIASGLILVTGTPAAAVGGIDEGCPRPFEGLTLVEQLELAAQHGVPEQEVLAAFEAINRNDDDILCFMFLPLDEPNIIDNVAGKK
jgi:hypothetical protein